MANIKEFKIGDLITRNEPVTYGNNNVGDSSYCGERLILKGHDKDSKIIFLEDTNNFKGDILDLSYARDAWDEGWCLYPETMWQKIKKIV